MKALVVYAPTHACSMSKLNINTTWKSCADKLINKEEKNGKRRKQDEHRRRTDQQRNGKRRQQDRSTCT